MSQFTLFSLGKFQDVRKYACVKDLTTIIWMNFRKTSKGPRGGPKKSSKFENSVVPNSHLMKLSLVLKEMMPVSVSLGMKYDIVG